MCIRDRLLKDFGVKELDYLVISHPHIDHVGGAVTAVEYLKSIGGTVKHFWHSPADLKNYVCLLYTSNRTPPPSPSTPPPPIRREANAPPRAVSEPGPICFFRIDDSLAYPHF